jgi:hypothetical protein
LRGNRREWIRASQVESEDGTIGVIAEKFVDDDAVLQVPHHWGARKENSCA